MGLLQNVTAKEADPLGEEEDEERGEERNEQG
jgi:hypothetical protein